MDAMDCRSPRACATCPHSTRSGACGLEADLNLALDALYERPRFVVANGPLRALA